MRRATQPWWRRRVAIGGGGIVVLAIVVTVFVAFSHQGGSTGDTQIGTLAPTDLVQKVATTNPVIIAAVGGGKLPTGDTLPPPIHAIAGPALTANGKPELLFIGGEYCSHCAGLRWSVINALGRFGTFSNLQYMRTSDDYGDLATLDFYYSAYSSPYVSFVPVENRDRAANELQPLTTDQAQLLDTVGGSTYPLLDIAGQYTNDAKGAYGGGYDFSVLDGKDWSQIVGALSTAGDPITEGIVGTGNYITAALCRATHDQPSSACNAPTIQRLKKQLAP